MLYGDHLRVAIDRLGLSVNAFAKKCVRPDGSNVSVQAIYNFIRMKDVKAEDDTAKAIERALGHHCKTCGQYTEDPNAWEDHSATGEEDGDGEGGAALGPA